MCYLNNKSLKVLLEIRENRNRNKDKNHFYCALNLLLYLHNIPRNLQSKYLVDEQSNNGIRADASSTHRK